MSKERCEPLEGARTLTCRKCGKPFTEQMPYVYQMCPHCQHSNIYPSERSARLHERAADVARLVDAARAVSRWRLTDEAVAKLGFDPASYAATFESLAAALSPFQEPST